MIHTPSEDAYKWWPGDMGRSATHVLVMAQILIPEEDGEVNNYGVGMFIVQCRDGDTHKWMPGI